jgi:exonuclease SbcC
MINFKYVELANFLSYGNQPTRFNLDTNESVLIIGRNEDVGDGGEARNGVGKSSAIQAILFALYGKGIEPKLKSDDFVNIKNGKKLEVKLTFEKGGKEYTIIRKRKPASLELFVDGEPATLDTMKNTDQVIESIIGMPYEIFMLTFVMTPHIDSFLSVTPSDQRSMIEAMLSLNVLSERAESLKLIRKELEVDIKVFERDLANAEQVNARTDENIERLTRKLNEFELEVEESIKQLEAFLSQDIDFEAIQKEFDKKSENLLTIDEVSASIAKYTKEMNELKSRIVLLNKDLEQLKQTKTEIETLTEKSKSYKTEIESELKQYETTESLEEIEQDIELLEEIESELKKVKSLKSEIKKLEDEIASLEVGIKRDAIVYEKEIKRLQEELETKKDEVKHLETGKCHVCGHDYVDEEAIEKLERKIKSIQVEIDESNKSHIETVDNLSLRIKKESSKKDSLVDELVAVESVVLGKLGELSISEDEVSELLSVLYSSQKQTISLKAKYDATLSKLKTNPYKDRLNQLLEQYSDIDTMIDSVLGSISTTKDSINLTETVIADGTEKLSGLKSMTYQLLARHSIVTQADIDRQKRDFSDAKTGIAELSEKPNPYAEEIEEAKKMKINVSSIKKSVDGIRYDIENIGYLIKLLTSNNSFIRKNILDLYIPYLNKQILQYTEQLGLMHVISINNDLSTNILYMGKDVSYFNLSQGERLRANLAATMSFRDLVSKLGKNSNITIIDEMLDAGGDTSLVNRTMNLLSSKGGYRAIISHRSDISDFVDSTVTIVKRNGFSIVE